MRLSLILTFILFTFSSVASAKQDVMYENAYIELPTYMRKMMPEDDNHVRFLFDFNCGYCRTLQPYMVSWAATLPNKISFSHEPIVIEDSMYLLNAAAMYFVQSNGMGQEQVYRYMEHIFANISKVSDERQLTRLIKEAMADTGANFKDFARLYIQGEYESRLRQQIELQKGINVQYTPTVVIGGRYMTHLGLNKGETKDFIPLLNAITSMYIFQE
jgi:protein-disulfide isomerase